jgi:hypothetical protein
MDFGQRPVGGAGPLVNMVRAFAASGIANRVVALFDYDTAAADALRNLDLQSLPTNIHVRQYPELGLGLALSPRSGRQPRDSLVS